MCTNSIIQKTSHSPPSETSLERRNPNLNILLGGRRPSRLLSALPPLLLLLLFRLSSPSFPVLPFSKFEGFVPPRYQIWCCFSWNSGEAWRRRECEVPSLGCGCGSLDLTSDLDSWSRSVSFLCLFCFRFSVWVRWLSWLKAFLDLSRWWRCGVYLLVLVLYAGVSC